MSDTIITNLFGDEVQQKETYCNQCANFATTRCKSCQFDCYNLNSKPTKFKEEN